MDDLQRFFEACSTLAEDLLTKGLGHRVDPCLRGPS